MIRERDYDLTCAIFQMSALIRIKYLTNDFSERTTDLLIDPDAVLTSQTTHGHSCITDSRGFLHFDLEFDSGPKNTSLGVVDDNDLMLFFQRKSDTYELLGMALEYTLNPQTFPGHFMPNGSVMVATVSFESGDFLIPRGNSYSCKSRQEIPMDATTDDVSLIIKEFKFDVFNFHPKALFSPSVSCTQDVSPPSYGFDWATLLVFIGMVVIISCCVAGCFVICRRWNKMYRASSHNQLSSRSLHGIPGVSLPFPSDRSVKFNLPEKV